MINYFQQYRTVHIHSRKLSTPSARLVATAEHQRLPGQFPGAAALANDSPENDPEQSDVIMEDVPHGILSEEKSYDATDESAVDFERDMLARQEAKLDRERAILSNAAKQVAKELEERRARIHQKAKQVEKAEEEARAALEKRRVAIKNESNRKKREAILRLKQKEKENEEIRSANQFLRRQSEEQEKEWQKMDNGLRRAQERIRRASQPPSPEPDLKSEESTGDELMISGASTEPGINRTSGLNHQGLSQSIWRPSPKLSPGLDRKKNKDHALGDLPCSSKHRLSRSKRMSPHQVGRSSSTCSTSYRCDSQKKVSRQFGMNDQDSDPGLSLAQSALAACFEDMSLPPRPATVTHEPDPNFPLPPLPPRKTSKSEFQTRYKTKSKSKAKDAPGSDANFDSAYPVPPRRSKSKTRFMEPIIQPKSGSTRKRQAKESPVDAAAISDSDLYGE